MLHGSVLGHILFVVYINEICNAGFCPYSNVNIKQNYSQMMTNFISVSMFHLSTCFIAASTISYEGLSSSSGSLSCHPTNVLCWPSDVYIITILLVTFCYQLFTVLLILALSRIVEWLTFKLHINIIRGRARAKQRAAMMLRTFY